MRPGFSGEALSQLLVQGGQASGKSPVLPTLATFALVVAHFLPVTDHRSR